MFSPLAKCAIFKVVFSSKISQLSALCIIIWGVGVCVCVLLMKGALGELGITVSKCIQLVCFHNSHIYELLCMNESKILGRNLGGKKSFVPSAGAHILHWVCEIVALKCLHKKCMGDCTYTVK